MVRAGGRPEGRVIVGWVVRWLGGWVVGAGGSPEGRVIVGAGDRV